MLLTTWITPAILAILTAVYYNRKTAYMVATDHFLLYTIFDIIKTYSFMMIFLSLTISTSIYLVALFVIIFFFSSFIHLSINHRLNGDEIVLFETTKNSVIIQVTTFVPFLVFMYLFRTFNSQLFTIFLSIGASILLCFLSLFIKKIMHILTELIKKQFLTSSTYLQVFYYLIAAIVLAGVISFYIASAKESITSQMLNRSEHMESYHMFITDNTSLDWSKMTLIASQTLYEEDYFTTDRMIVHSDAGDTTLVIRNVLEEGDLPTEHFLSLSADGEMFSGDYLRFFGQNDTIVVTSSGLYHINDGTMTIIPETSNKESYYVNLNDQDRFIVKEDQQSYTLYNPSMQVDQTITNVNLKVISNRLFIETSTSYVYYEDNNISFDRIDGATPYFNISNNNFYQITKTDNLAIVDIQTNNVKEQLTIPLSENDRITPSYEGTLYADTQFAFRKKHLRFYDGIDFYVYETEKNRFDTFIVYDAYNYLIGETSDGTDITNLEFINPDSTLISSTTVDFSDNHEPLITNTNITVIRYSFFIFVFLCLPITNDEQYVTISSFEEKVKKQ